MIGIAPDADQRHGAADHSETGLMALSTILGMHRIAADPRQLRHSLGHPRALEVDDVLRLAKRQEGVRARALSAGFDRLQRLPLPAMAEGPEGWFLIGRAAEQEALIHRPGHVVEKCSRDELERIWSGRLVLITTREGIEGAAAPFGAGWFLPQIVRYRRLIGEVLLITFALNLLGLAAPLFFQNIIDKVLVHNTMATLQVLIIGLVAVSVLETMFGWLRTRLYS